MPNRFPCRLSRVLQSAGACRRLFGSFRVMYVIAELLDLCKVDPPLPVLPLRDEARDRVSQAKQSVQQLIR